MKFVQLIVLLLTMTSAVCSAQQFTQADLAGQWSGTSAGGLLADHPVTFAIDAQGNLSGDFSGQLTLTDPITGAIGGTIEGSPVLNMTVSSPGLNGRSFRLIGTWGDPRAGDGTVWWDVSGGPRQYQQADLIGVWNGTYIWNDGTGTLPVPFIIPTIQFTVDAQGNISGNGFSGTLTVDVTGLVTGSIVNASVGTLTLVPSDNIHLQSPGQNGLPFRIVTPSPFVGYSADISGPAVPPPPTPPAITSALSVVAPAGIAFSYTIVVTGTAPVSVSAAGLPPGLFLNGATISGTPTVAGTNAVLLSATNSAGTASQTLLISIYAPPPPQNQKSPGGLPPSITSPPSTSETIAAAGDQIEFTVAATDANGNALTYTWDFGDGTIVSGGSTITHVYVAGGPYLVTVTVSNGNAATASTPIPIDIADGRVDLGTVSLSKLHGKFGFTLAVPPGFPKHGVKSQLVLGALGDGVKYSNLKLRGKTSATGSFTFALEFTSRKPALTMRIIYTYALVR